MTSFVTLALPTPLRLHKKEGGVGWKWMHSVFKMDKSLQETPLPLQVGQKNKQHLDYGETLRQQSLPTVSLSY